MCILVMKDAQECSEQDLEVKQQRPIPDIEQIVLDAPLKLFQRVEFATPAVDLSPTGEAWPHLTTALICLHRVHQRSLGTHPEWVRTRADDRHVTAQHVQ